METQPTQQQAWLLSMKEGQQNYQKGNMATAIPAFIKATKLLPQRAEGWVNLGSALLEFNRYTDAAKALSIATSLNPQLSVSHMLLGDALRQLGKQEKALASYREAVDRQRNPMTLNRLACSLRVEREAQQAEELYEESVRMDPAYTLARVNLATVQIELGRFEQAQKQLHELAGMQLPEPERAEVESAQSALAEYFRLSAELAALSTDGNLAKLEAALRNTPEKNLQVDQAVLDKIKLYADSAKRTRSTDTLEAEPLPGEWPLIEALFMIPHIETVAQYRGVKADIAAGLEATGDRLESINMEPVIRAARACQLELQDPVKAELHLRHWHAISSRDVLGFQPGHFKYTQNWTAKSPLVKRVDPALASGTLRNFISDIYQDLAPGPCRAAVVLLAVCDIHPFADGNGRIAVTWLNRELEWAGLMPALFAREFSFKGELTDAMRAARSNGGDISPILPVILKAQLYAREFNLELAKSQ